MFEEKDDSGNIVLDENGDPKMKSSVFIRGHHVFNIEQCEGLEKYYEEYSEPEKSSEMQTRPDLDVLPNKMGMQLYNKTQDRACYMPRKDCIVMPDFKNSIQLTTTMQLYCMNAVTPPGIKTG
ncbi:antirestriction protein [Haemophilus influenzae]|uniref:Antirestriction protein n=1 Tax=Haemophilus influenzae TaxID=727 RepID=A0A2X1PVN4_HAEIF|nr:antirestriction protein [Haemophilus influenzae]